MIKIVKVTADKIIFDNGDTISYDHVPDCCEWNYADFEQLDDLARNYKYDETQMRFEFVPDSGFRFGDNRSMFFVPCYSYQSGWYSSDVEIYYNNKKVCHGDAFEC